MRHGAGARWRAALRIARREAWRARARSLLVLALVGLPVLVLAGADIAYRTWQLDPGERLGREIGTASAGIKWEGGQVEQEPSAWLGSVFGSGGAADRGFRIPDTAAVRAQLPAHSRVIAWRQSPEPIWFTTRAGLADGDLVGLDYADPIAHGMVVQADGRAPRTPGEVALTTRLATVSGLRVGDVLRAERPRRTFRVVGLVRDPGNRAARTAYVLPSVVPLPARTVDRRTAGSFAGAVGWLVRSPRPVSWTDVLRLNRSGLAVLSRHVYLDPPPASRIPVSVRSSGMPAGTISTVALIAGMALLEVVLLAGPAFAVSARRRRHELALVAAVGGRRADLRRIVLADGVVLGLAGGVLAVGAAIALTAALIPGVGPVLTSRVPGHFDLRPGELAALVAVSLLTSLLAAAFPARTAARTDVVAALAGRRGTVRTRRSVPVAGAAVAGLGVVVTLGAAGTVTARLLLVGVVLLELGLIISTPALIGLAARAGRWLPVAGRIALRDAGRNRSAATPAVAAVMAAVIGAVALALGVASEDHRNRATYRQYLPRRDAWVDLASSAEASASAVAAAVRSALPDAPARVIDGPARDCYAISGQETAAPSCTEISVVQQRHDVAGYPGTGFGTVVIAGPGSIDALLGRHVAAAQQALARGAAIVFSPAYLSGDGTATVATDQRRIVRGSPDWNGSGTNPRRTRLPAIAVTGGFPAALIVLSPSAAAAAGLTPSPVGVVSDRANPPTDAQLQRLNLALANLDPSLSVAIERGYTNPDGWLPLAFVVAAGLVAVFAALIATALANVDGAADLATLGAVGAAPRVRRVLSLARAAVIAGLGAVLGTAAGFAPAAAWAHSQHIALVVPAAPLLAALVGVPTVAALIAGLFVRARLPSERPAT